MADKINGNTLDKNVIGGISENVFDKLNDDQKSDLIAANNDLYQKKAGAGKFGEWFGTNTQNASIHIALVICGLLLIFCGIDLIHSFFPNQTLNSEIWNLIFPVVTLALGYIFGKGQRN